MKYVILDNKCCDKIAFVFNDRNNLQHKKSQNIVRNKGYQKSHNNRVSPVIAKCSLILQYIVHHDRIIFNRLKTILLWSHSPCHMSLLLFFYRWWPLWPGVVWRWLSSSGDSGSRSEPAGWTEPSQTWIHAAKCDLCSHHGCSAPSVPCGIQRYRQVRGAEDEPKV